MRRTKESMLSFDNLKRRINTLYTNNLKELLEKEKKGLFERTGYRDYSDSDLIMTDILALSLNYSGLSPEDCQEIFWEQISNNPQEYESNIDVIFNSSIPSDGDVILLLCDNYIIGGGVYDESRSLEEKSIYFYYETMFLTNLDFVVDEEIEEYFVSYFPSDRKEDIWVVPFAFLFNYEASEMNSLMGMLMESARRNELNEKIINNYMHYAYERIDYYELFVKALEFDSFLWFNQENPYLGVMIWKQNGHKCMMCNELYDLKEDDEYHLDIHMMGSKIDDYMTISDKIVGHVAVCPNCHRKIHLNSEDELPGLFELKRVQVASELINRLNDIFDSNDLEDIFTDENETLYEGSSYDSYNDFDPSSWAQESILAEYGYTVSQKENLTEEERHNIIMEVIDNDDMTKYEIINHLEAMINLRQYQDKYRMAISKWEKDIEFVRKL